MSKKYLDIGEHGLNGDFYRCDDGPAFRADNLAIATKIAFNDWLRQFNPLGQGCSLSSIVDGEFMVSIEPAGCPSYTERHSISYYGPADMFSCNYRHECGMRLDWYAKMYNTMERLVAAGDPRVRLSKRSSLIMFTAGFPRYRANGEWWSSENTYLGASECRIISDETDPDRAAAEEQFEYVFATPEERTVICKRNSEAARAKTAREIADAGIVIENEQTGTCDNCKKPLFNHTTTVHNHGKLMATLCTDCGLDHPEIVDKFYYSKQEA